MNKTYLLVALPTNDEGALMSINKNDFYESWEDATDAFSEAIANLGGEPLKTPKTPQVLSQEIGDSIIQLWECKLPIVNL